jgi:hypothetical protein
VRGTRIGTDNASQVLSRLARHPVPGHPAFPEPDDGPTHTLEFQAGSPGFAEAASFVPQLVAADWNVKQLHRW